MVTTVPRKIRLAPFALAALIARVGVAAPGEPPRVAHERLTCVPSDGNSRVAATVSAGAPIISARVYFKAVDRDRDYYLEMRRGEGGSYWAILPVPESATKGVQYRIVVRDGDGMDGSTDVAVATTSSNCPVTLTDEEKRYAQNLVIGLTRDDQKAIPEGFRCVGLVSKITVHGELKPNDECLKIPAALWVAGGAAALLGGGIIVANPSSGPPVSSPRPVPAAPR
jgi:hypothetical protein